MKEIRFKKWDECHGCEGSAYQMNEFGFIRPCPYCNASRRMFANKYGSDVETQLEMFVDVEERLIRKIGKKEQERGYIIGRNGKKIYFNQQ